MKGLNIDFSTVIQKKEESISNKDDKITGEMIGFSIEQSKKDSIGNQRILTGKHLDFELTIAGKWSLVEKKPSICMICKLPLKENQTIARCPMCQSLFHDSHIFEWLKVKGKCPVCQQNLRPGGTEEVKL